MTDYNLPDIQLLEDKTKPFLIWIPDKTYIVLGASNRADEALFLERVLLDGITVLKRPSGGQTVMLTPDNLIISVVYSNPKELQPKDVFLKTNSLIILALEKAGIHDLSLRGISDIAIDGKKILGSSIYRNKDSLLYHAVLNLAEPASTFEKYLKHPTKEPDYRQGRKHTDFVTSLKEKGYTPDYHQLTNLIVQSMEEALLTHISTNDPTNK
jgi:lipoate---protein ligase